MVHHIFLAFLKADYHFQYILKDSGYMNLAILDHNKYKPEILHYIVLQNNSFIT